MEWTHGFVWRTRLCHPGKWPVQNNRNIFVTIRQVAKFGCHGNNAGFSTFARDAEYQCGSTNTEAMDAQQLCFSFYSCFWLWTSLLHQVNRTMEERVQNAAFCAAESGLQGQVCPHWSHVCQNMIWIGFGTTSNLVPQEPELELVWSGPQRPRDLIKRGLYSPCWAMWVSIIGGFGIS